MQNKAGMTQSGFNRRQKMGFNYRVADSEMKAGAVRCCISTVPFASHFYQPLLEIAVLACQGVSRASITSAEIRVSSERPENTFDSPKHFRWVFPLSLLFCFSWSLPNGAEAAALSWHFMYVLYAKFWERWEGQATEMWTALANSSSSKDLHAPDALLLAVSMLYSLAFTL